VAAFPSPPHFPPSLLMPSGILSQINDLYSHTCVTVSFWGNPNEHISSSIEHIEEKIKQEKQAKFALQPPSNKQCSINAELLSDVAKIRWCYPLVFTHLITLGQFCNLSGHHFSHLLNEGNHNTLWMVYIYTSLHIIRLNK
jgi:hypothetical protein